MASCKPPEDDDDPQKHPYAGRHIYVNSGSFTNAGSQRLFARRTYTDGQVYLGTLIVGDDGAVSIQSSAADFTKSGATYRVDFTLTTPQDPDNPPASISETPVLMIGYALGPSTTIPTNKLPFESSKFILKFPSPVHANGILLNIGSPPLGTNFLGTDSFNNGGRAKILE